MDNISEMITLCRDSRHSSDWLKTAAEDMATKSRSYTTQVGNIFIFMTAILDPESNVSSSLRASAQETIWRKPELYS
ncbi:hypothetical protein NC653_028465 [Populus alba x Populus x berolinensis]|uniref:Uncharacterized protein n=1 Tax=Populus alba x Populus x berolinensis TaxID=444605 RepID=A0AAD6M076_9ROSI|nr:hypothetical protein NC653_028465 [Populus alba x Populus x berolinensis]